MRVHVNKGMPSFKKFMAFIYENDEIADMDIIKEQMNKAMLKYLEDARN
jgi:hypothetical protein